MDYSENNNLQPTVVLAQKSFLQTRLGKIIVLSILSLGVFVALVFTLNYSNIQTQTDPIENPVRITLIENYGSRVGGLTLSCPVESIFCNTQRLINLDNKDTISYKASPESVVLNILEIQNLENIAVLEDRKIGKKYFYESVISKDSKSCYTIAYTLPKDASFENILDLNTFLEEKRIATLGSQTFKIEGEEANVLIQVRNTPMDPGTPCSLIQKNPEFFKKF